MRTDGEPVCFVAQPLDEIEQRIARRQLYCRPVRQIESLVAGVAVAAYGLLPRNLAAQIAVSEGIVVSPPEDAPLTPAHWRLMVVLVIALVIDQSERRAAERGRELALAREREARPEAGRRGRPPARPRRRRGRPPAGRPASAR